MVRQGFTLVELSIVLVILGLLVGGVLSGQSLIRAAELRSVNTQIQNYTAAVYTFRDKYFAVPGDMPNAIRFWGARATGTSVACHQTIGVTTGTCNGDGNGIISEIVGDATGGESYAFWQHLARAGLIEGSYTGASASASADLRSPGVNIPLGRLSNSMFLVAWLDHNLEGYVNYFSTYKMGNVIGVKSKDNGSILRPEEMWNLDVKLDDGKPGAGKIVTYKNTSVDMRGCATTDDSATAEYAVSDSGIKCYLLVYTN